MLLPIEIAADAEQEFSAAVAWYTERSLRAAVGLAAAFEQALATMQRWPEQGAPYVAGTRHVRLQRYPYLIVYEVLPDSIHIVAFSHGSRRKGYRAGRLKR